MYRKLCFQTIVIFVFIFSLIGIPAAQGAEDGHIMGKILTAEGVALSGGSVLFYNATTGSSPISGEYQRSHDRRAFLANDGSFSVMIPEGTYYMIAIKNIGAKRLSPPEEGDLIYPPFDGREPKVYKISAAEPIDLGIISEAVPFQKEWIPAAETGIEGRVLLENGTPAEDVLVLATTDPEMRDFIFISDARTDMNGKFIVRVDKDGDYYVRAKGDRKSFVKAQVSWGEITKGIDIKVKTNPSRKHGKRTKAE